MIETGHIMAHAHAMIHTRTNSLAAYIYPCRILTNWPARRGMPPSFSDHLDTTRPASQKEVRTSIQGPTSRHAVFSLGTKANISSRFLAVQYPASRHCRSVMPSMASWQCGTLWRKQEQAKRKAVVNIYMQSHQVPAAIW